MTDIYAVGKPGEAVRIFFRMTEDRLGEQLQDGEVYVAVSEFGEYEIAADGLSVIAAAVDLAQAKADRWVEARAYRDTISGGGCSTSFGRVDTDPDSQRLINGAASAAGFAKQAGSAFAVDWTMADNTVVTLDADAIIAVGMAVVAFLDAVQKAGTAIRDKIDAAADAAALTAIDITAGYPA